MSNQKNEVTVSPAVEPPATSYAEAAQAFVEELRRMRQKIPHFVIPTIKGGRQTLSSAASVAPEFVELATVARTNHPVLARGEETTAAESRDLMAYADAFAPVAAELEAMAQYVRFSTDAAKNKAGYAALTTYALARRLVRRPEHAGLAPHVAAMRRAFGSRGKRVKPDAAKKQQLAPQQPEEK